MKPKHKHEPQSSSGFSKKKEATPSTGSADSWYNAAVSVPIHYQQKQAVSSRLHTANLFCTHTHTHTRRSRTLCSMCFFTCVVLTAMVTEPLAQISLLCACLCVGVAGEVGWVRDYSRDGCGTTSSPLLWDNICHHQPHCWGGSVPGD